MVDSLKTFNEGEYIYASETNNNNQYLLSKLSDNAAQVQTFVEGEISSIQSNVASVQATLQANIDGVKSTVDTLNANVYTNLAPNYSAGVSISSGYTATKNGWIYYYITSSANNTTKVLIDGKDVAYNWQGAGDQRAGGLRIGGMVYIAKGQKMTTSVTGSPTNEFTFYPCKGGN